MSSTLARSTREGEHIYYLAPLYEMRTGQLLFNVLRYEIAEAVRDTELDTFYKDMTLQEIIDWLENHILYDNQGRMVRLCGTDGRILWAEQYAA